MDGYYVFFRCWPGFCEPFPFGQFDSLPDKELNPALESFAHQQLESPDVRKQIKLIARRQRKALLEGVAAARGQFTARPGRCIPPTKPAESPSRLWRRRRCEARQRPLICRLGEYLGWCSASTRLPGSPVWFLHTPSRELAELLIEELNEQRRLDYDDHIAEQTLRVRFAFLDGGSFKATQKASIGRCVDAIQNGRRPAVQEAKLALYIGQRAWKVAQELADAWPADDPPVDVAGILSSTSDPVPAESETGLGGGKSCEDAAARLERQRKQGEPFTSQADMAKQIGYSVGIVNRAIHSSDLLKKWAGVDSKGDAAPKAQSLNEVVKDNVPQCTEPDPSDVLEPDDIDNALRALIEQAGSDERARIHSMDPVERAELAKTAYKDVGFSDKVLGRKA